MIQVLDMGWLDMDKHIGCQRDQRKLLIDN